VDVVAAYIEKMEVLACGVGVHALARELLQVGEKKVLQALAVVARGIHEAEFLRAFSYG
jgi:hypothetical protein